MDAIATELRTLSRGDGESLDDVKSYYWPQGIDWWLTDTPGNWGYGITIAFTITDERGTGADPQQEPDVDSSGKMALHFVKVALDAVTCRDVAKSVTPLSGTEPGEGENWQRLVCRRAGEKDAKQRDVGFENYLHAPGFGWGAEDEEEWIWRFKLDRNENWNNAVKDVP
jgi:hypothetical protein